MAPTIGQTTRTTSLPLLARASNLSLTNLIQNIDSPLLHAATLDVNAAQKLVRKTSIIATIGPKTNSPEAITQLRQAGVNIARLNFSHGTHEYHAEVVANVRKSCAHAPGRPVAIALDTKGPEIRLGVVEGEIKVAPGHEITFTTDPAHKDAGKQTGDNSSLVYIDYKNITKVMAPGKLIYVDDGTLMFRVERIDADKVHAVAVNSGKITSRKGCNLPGTNIDLPALSDKDKLDLEFALKHDVDMIFASFIRDAENVQLIRQVLGEKGKHIKIISKIENHQGLDNFDEILDESDGVMVARGDLGTEIPIEKIFIAQKKIIAKCNILAKPVICATQMLHTMQFTPRPTRAEVSDVANAVYDGADCVMLSGETASGAYPVESVQYMEKIAKEAEASASYLPFFNDIRELTRRPTVTTETIACSAVNASFEENAGAIIVLTTSGNTARYVSKYRPKCPIIVVTRDGRVARQIHLHRGCYPLHYAAPAPAGAEGTTHEWLDDVDKRVSYGIKMAKDMGLLYTGETVIAVQGWKSGTGNTNTMRVMAAE